MDVRALKKFVEDHPEGVRIRMVDGREFKVPHRDYVSFNPGPDSPEGRRAPYGTAFFVWKDEVPHLLNDLLVEEVTGLRAGRNGSNGRRRGRGR